MLRQRNEMARHVQLRLLHESSQDVRSATFRCWHLLLSHWANLYTYNDILCARALLPLTKWLPFLLQLSVTILHDAEFISTHRCILKLAWLW